MPKLAFALITVIFPIVQNVWRMELQMTMVSWFRTVKTQFFSVVQKHAL
jgi:hypothetical protein